MRRGQGPRTNEIWHVWVLLQNHTCLLVSGSRHWKDDSKYKTGVEKYGAESLGRAWSAFKYRPRLNPGGKAYVDGTPGAGDSS